MAAANVPLLAWAGLRASVEDVHRLGAVQALFNDG